MCNELKYIMEWYCEVLCEEEVYLFIEEISSVGFSYKSKIQL